MDPRSSPPSPAASSPSLTQSVSNSSSSPPQPTTPPRQPRPRYPDLGRVPLHRRGTSKTYERLEDLLREAGYKETRIFTPESDKPRHPLNHTRDGDEDQGTDQSKKQGVGAAVVGFLTGLVTGGRNNNVTTASDSRHQVLDLGSQSDDSNSSTSPLAHKQQRRDNGSLRSTSSKLQTPLITPSTHSLSYTPKAYHRQNLYPYYENQSRPSSRPTTPSPFQYPTSSPQHRRQLSVAQLQLQHKASHSSIHSTAAVPVRQGSGGQIRATVIQHPRPSRAGTYLRHMVSTPLIPSERPNSTPAACQHFQRNSHIGNSLSDIEGGVTTTKSPLPRNWLDNVARAIIFGVAATGVTTSTTTSSSNTSYFLSHHHQRTLRATRSSLSQTTIARNNARRSGLSDQTNVISAGPSLECLVPPALFTRLEKGRAPSSQGLLKAQVVCRSAPASRASSAVRGQNAGGGHRGTRQLSKRHLKDGNGRAGTEDNTRGRQQFTAAHSKATDKFKPKEKKNKKSQKADAGKPRVPTLARTRIEGDGWHTLHPRATTTTPQTHPIPYSSSDTEHTTPSLYRRHATPKSGYSSGYVSATNSYFPDSSTSESVHDFSTDHDADDGDDDDDDDDDDEGELTLARMLVPPKRQHSIRSLRQHLHLHFASSPAPFHTTTTSSRSRSDAATIMTLKNHNKLRPSLSRRPAYHSSSTATLRSNSALGGHGGGGVGGDDGTDVGRRVTSFSVARSRLLNLVVSTGSEKDLTTTPTKTPTTAVGVNVTRRTAAGGGGGGGEWEREWRKGKYSSRKSNEDEDEVESLTWLNRDDDDDNVIVAIASNTTTPTTSATANSTSTSTTTGGTITKATGSQKSGKGKSRLGLPSWKSPTMMTTTSAASLAR